MLTGLTHDVSINSDAFNVHHIGIYKVYWNLSADSQGTGKTYEVGIFVNGVEEAQGSGSRAFGSVGSLGSFSGAAPILIEDITHDIDLRIKEITAGGGAGTDIDIFDVNFGLDHKGGENASRGYMFSHKMFSPSMFSPSMFGRTG